MKKTSTFRWGITFLYNGKPELYVGQYLTRKDAIDRFCKSRSNNNIPFTPKERNRIWRERRRLGERCVRLYIVY